MLDEKVLLIVFARIRTKSCCFIKLRSGILKSSIPSSLMHERRLCTGARS